MKRYKLLIKGRVQGVYYRVSAQRKAEELGLSGFVKNEPDGSVYAEAEGDEDKIQAFTAWCHKGPPLAKVSGVETAEIPLMMDEGFTVVREI